MPKYVVRITAPYVRTTDIGVVAETELEAQRAALELYKSGCDEDSDKVKWLNREYESLDTETEPKTQVLSSYGDALPFPPASGEVKYDRRCERALDICRKLILVYANAENSEQIDWEDIDELYAEALELFKQ